MAELPPTRRRPRHLLTLAAIAALTACGSSWSPPRPPPGEPSRPPPSAKPAAADTPRVESFATLRERIIHEWVHDDPAFGRGLGLRQADGKVADCSAAAIQRRLARLSGDRRALAAIDAAALSPDDALDRAILLQRLDLALFQGNDLEDWRRWPQVYGDLFGVNDYLDRAYAPLAERALRLLEHEKAALEQVPHIRQNLASPLSKPVVEVAVKIYRGYAEYLRGDVVKLLAGVGDQAFQEDFARTNEALAAEAQKLADHLEQIELPKGDASHVLGEERYRKLLLAQEGLETPLVELKKMGEDNLASNKAAFVALRKKGVRARRPKTEKLLAEATRIMEESRKFVIDRKIISLPSDDRTTLKETPPYMRWNSAFLRDPGPFDAKGLEAYYYMTMPDPAWPKKEQEEYVMTFGSLLATTVHEVYPGHFVHGLWLRNAPTSAQKMFTSYSFSEGWAHYTEQMMVDEGFGARDPQSRLGQLEDALLRNCRFVVSIGLHTEGMSLDEAERRFVDDCFTGRATAREQAVRGTFDPGYFAYTLGKLQILDLREEVKARMGASFSLQRFHDALLSHGSPPVPLIRERVLAELTAPAKQP